MKEKEVKITMTLEDLRMMLLNQKELAGEIICKVAHQITVDGKTDTSIIRNEVRNARFPDDFNVLKKYLS